MSFLDFLQDLGDRLHILESPAGTAAQPAEKIQMRTVTLAELATEIRSEEVRALADLPAELSIPFEKIYETAGIQRPANGWNVDRLKQFLQTDALKGKDRTIVQTAILNILKTEGASVEDVVKDAMARDKALDSFETFVRKKMEDRMTVRQRKAAELESQISGLRAELDRLKDKESAEESKWKEWRTQKRTEERQLAWAVGHLIDRQVITTDDEE